MFARFRAQPTYYVLRSGLIFLIVCRRIMPAGVRALCGDSGRTKLPRLLGRNKLVTVPEELFRGLNLLNNL